VIGRPAPPLRGGVVGQTIRDASREKRLRQRPFAFGSRAAAILR
jgi:hypothetical protein